MRLKRALASLAHFARCLGRYSLNGDYAVGHDQVARALGTVHFEVIKQTRRERDAALVDRDRKIERLEAKLDAVPLRANPYTCGWRRSSKARSLSRSGLHSCVGMAGMIPARER